MLATIDLVISVHVILLQYITLLTAIPIELFKMLKRDFRIDLGGIHKPCGHVTCPYYYIALLSKMVHKGGGGGQKSPNFCPHGL